MGKFVSEESESVTNINEILYRNSHRKEESPIDKEKKNKIQTILSIGFYVFFIIILLVALKIYKGRASIRSINVDGYATKPAFNEKIFDYEVTVHNNEVEVTCDARGEIEGCNTTLDLTGRKEYIHMIKIPKMNGYKIYKITITNNTRDSK